MDIRKLQKMVGMYVKVDWRQYFDENTSPAVQSYITKNADSLYPWLYDIIKHAISKKLDEVAIIKFIDSKMYATIKKEDYKELLNKILNHYISKEEYEKCAEIRDLINKKERKIRKKQKEVVIL
jgi:hypothetical protein